jgi:Lrp/AsnC family transcriptional regulator
VNKIEQIDALDRRILSELQGDALLSHSKLAERVATSPASCWRRIKALTERGIMQRAVYLLDPEKTGCSVNVLCNVRLRSHERMTVEAFEAFVGQRSEVLECFSMSGEWDYLLRIVVTDVADYERFLMRTLLAQSSVASAASNFALKLVKYTTALPV